MKQQKLKVGTRYGDWILFQDEQKTNNRNEAIAWFKCRHCDRKVEKLISVAKRKSRCQQCYLKGRLGQHIKSIGKLSLASKKRYNILNEKEREQFAKQESNRANQYNKESRLTAFGRSRQLFHSVKHRASNEKVPFKITRNWIFEKIKSGRCEVTGIPFDFTSPGYCKTNKYAPSLDRTNKKNGYTPNNTKVVVWFYNTAKNCFSHNELIEFAKVLSNLKPT